MSRTKTPFFERYIKRSENRKDVLPTASLRKECVRCSLCGEKLPNYPVGVWVDIIGGVEYLKAPMTTCVFLCVKCRELPDVEKMLIYDAYKDLVVSMDKYCERLESLRQRHHIKFDEVKGEVGDE